MRSDVLVNTGPTTFTKRWYVDGDQSDVGVVTYAVTDATGASVTSGTATKTGTGATTVYTFALAIQTALRSLRIAWTEDGGAIVVDRVEIVGSILFTETEARGRTISGGLAPLASTTTYTDAIIAEWRLMISDLFERATGRSWIRRYCRAELSGNGGYALSLFGAQRQSSTGDDLAGPGYARDIRRVIAATIGGTAITAANVKIIDGALHRTDGVWTIATPTDPLNVVVQYEYGLTEVDYEVRENALRMLLANAVPSDLSQWATSYSNEDGTQSFQPQTGWAYPPKVWDWLRSSDQRIAIA